MQLFKNKRFSAILLTVIAGVAFTFFTNSLPKEANSDADSKVIILNQTNFDQTIKKGVVLVDFWATWCGPCRVQGPIIDDLATVYKGKVTMGKLDVDQNKEISAKYGIQYLPTTIIFKNGIQVKKMVGLQSKEVLTATINEYVK